MPVTRDGPDACTRSPYVSRSPQAQGLAQLDGYLEGLGLDSGWLVIFDRRPGLVPVAERLASSVEKSPAGRVITVIRA